MTIKNVLRGEMTGRKARLMWATIVTAIAARYGLDVDLEFILGLIGLVAVRMLGIAAEDAGAKIGLPPPAGSPIVPEPPPPPSE